MNNICEEKLLVYIIISPVGLSTLFWNSYYQHVYVKQCLTKKLIPYIQKLSENSQYIIWPDLASSHYLNKSTQFLVNNNIKFVSKSENLPNTPEVCCIEDFWGCLKGSVYKDSWQIKNLNQLRSKLTYCIKMLDQHLVKRLTGSTLKRLDAFEEMD